MISFCNITVQFFVVSKTHLKLKEMRKDVNGSVLPTCPFADQREGMQPVQCPVSCFGFVGGNG